MKEASGELNMTAITIVAIALIGGFFYAFIWPTIRNNLTRSTKCANATCIGTCTNGVQACTYQVTNAAGQVTATENLSCPCRN